MPYSSSSQPASPSPGHGAEGIAHVVPPSVLLTVFAVLMVLTLATVAATWVNLGSWNLWIALGIATVKASLVALYFMHLRYDNPFYALIFVTALVFLGLFLVLTLMDTLQYAPTITNWR
ncbi:MAG: cytochrome C oxidase subunit IV family protein [Thermoguttaceae bacterium]